MPSLSASDVYEVAAGCLPKAETDFIVRLFRYIGRVTEGQALVADVWEDAGHYASAEVCEAG